MKNNDVICCSIMFQVGYFVWHIWPSVFCWVWQAWNVWRCCCRM